MTTLFNVTFENNKLYNPGSDGFDYISVCGGTLETSTSASYSGTYGCKVTPYTGYWAMGAKRVHSLTEFRQRFYFHPNGVTMNEASYITITRNYHSDAQFTYYRLVLRYTAADGYQLQAAVYSADDQSNMSGFYILPTQNGWNRIEMHWRMASSGSTLRYWVNGTLATTLTRSNLDTIVLYPSIGAYNVPSGFSGSYYFDNWTANDTGALIGA